MKIHSLLIQNFRGIQRVEANDLGETIIIAGQNSSGKSCIFDAIRLLKSTYGGYQANEWQQFFGEFQIQLNGGAKNLKGLFNDATQPCNIEIKFVLRDRERTYIKDHASELLVQKIWQNLLPEAFQFGGHHQALFAQQFRDRQPEVQIRLNAELPSLLAQLSEKFLIGKLNITSNGNLIIEPSTLLNVIFSNFRPREIGIVDFHGAQRHYGREFVQGINLNLEQLNQNYSQHMLYNYNNKYNNVKSEMAGNFIKELLAEKADGGADKTSTTSLTQTLNELFVAFFPDKKFLGPRATVDGSLSFPVVTQLGTEHDLDELSSGEKEILYGYLRMRSSAPRDSIILLDEPELHLNPRLIRGLPEFYRKHLGEALQNQLWLVTHSDAMIREAMHKPGFNVFHMLPCGAEGTVTSQLKALSVTQDLDQVLTDLVGDLAAYRPGGKALIFEGGGDADFDKKFVADLFREELRGINLISGTNKARVKALHEILEAAYSKGDLPIKFCAIVDRDTDDEYKHVGLSRFQWDVYHVENYLLEPDVIAYILNTSERSKNWTNEIVLEALKHATRLVIPSLVAHKMREYCNHKIINCIDLGFSPKSNLIGSEIYQALERSRQRIADVVANELQEIDLSKFEQNQRLELERNLDDGTWIKKLPGREILKQFRNSQKLLMPYELLRNLIIGRMSELGMKPPGMAHVINAIKSA